MAKEKKASDAKKKGALHVVDNEPKGGIQDKDVKKFAADIISEKSKMDKHRGEIGQHFKQFEDKGGHKKAFKAALALDNMETSEAQDFLRSFNRYMSVLGITERLKAAIDMFDGEIEMPEQPTAPKIPAKAS